MVLLRAFIVGAVMAVGGLTPAIAQDGASQMASPVLVVDMDRLFRQSAFGRKAAADLVAQSEALAAENRKIEADLTREEQSLTERRPNMKVADFRAEAEAFDQKVQDIRTAQDAKERALQENLSNRQDEFRAAVQPLLIKVMQSKGASVLLDNRMVALAAVSVNITDDMIVAIDEKLGDGTK